MALDVIFKLIGDDISKINNFFENWYNHTELTRLETIRALRLTGHLSVKHKQIDAADEFRCPLFGFSLIRSCGLTSCQYHLATSLHGNVQQEQMIQRCKNCVINCLDQSKNSRMSAHETACLLGISVSEVNNNNSTAISKIKRTQIKEQLEKYQIPRFKYLEGHCVNCERFIQDEIEMNLWPDLVIQPNKYGWCSNECRDKKPKWQFLIEKEFDCSYLHALTIGLFLYKNIESLGNIFALNKDILLKYKIPVQRNFDFIKRYFSS